MGDAAHAFSDGILLAALEKVPWVRRGGGEIDMVEPDVDLESEQVVLTGVDATVAVDASFNLVTPHFFKEVPVDVEIAGDRFVVGESSLGHVLCIENSTGFDPGVFVVVSGKAALETISRLVRSRDALWPAGQPFALLRVWFTALLRDGR